MKRTKSYIVIMAAIACLTGCVVVPMPTVDRACSVVDIALSEADMAAGWYEDAGEVLDACGVRGARERGEFKACMASVRDGYRTRDECHEQ